MGYALLLVVQVLVVVLGLLLVRVLRGFWGLRDVARSDDGREEGREGTFAIAVDVVGVYVSF